MGIRNERHTMHTARLALSASLLHLVACGAPLRDEPLGVAANLVEDHSDIVSVCDVAAPPHSQAVIAWAGGAVFVGDGANGTRRAHRTRGAGCALEPVGRPVAATAVLDVDGAGALHVLPATAAADEGALATRGEDVGWNHDVVIRVGGDDGLSEIVEAGRGIWGYGVAPSGETMWVTACGPTGIFTVASAGREVALSSPSTLWQQHPSVLTDDGTFWSVGGRTCNPGEPLDASCGHALVRTTAAGSDDVGATLLDVGGADLQQGVLSRCGDGVCVTGSEVVVVHDAAGAVRATITAATLGATDDEIIQSASGTADGVYVVLASSGRRCSPGTTRVVFAALAR